VLGQIRDGQDCCLHHFDPKSTAQGPQTFQCDHHRPHERTYGADPKGVPETGEVQGRCGFRMRVWRNRRKAGRCKAQSKSDGSILNLDSNRDSRPTRGTGGEKANHL
jgi:hypothetical protein